MVDSQTLVKTGTQENIQVLWNGFITSEGKSFEKLVWFDTFLAEFLALVKEGKTVKEILTSSATNCGSVSTLVSCELLSDVHNLCNVPGEGEELAALRDYLLTGRGWRCLAVLQCIGLQEVSCSRELTSLLISLYTVGGEDVEGEADLHNPYLSLRVGGGEDGEVVCRPQPLRRKSRSFSHSEATPPRKNSFRVPRAVTAPELGKDEESSESEDAESSEAHQIRSALKIRLNPMDFDYFTTVVRSDDEPPMENITIKPVHNRKSSTKQTPEDFCDVRIQDVMKQTINSFEFKMLLTELLSALVKSENVSQQISSNHQSVCLQTLNFSLETLCSLQFGSDVPSKRISQLKCFLSRLLLSSLDKVLVHPEMTLSALQKGVLPVMLRLAEDILRKHSADVVKEIKDTDEAQMTNEYIFSVIFGVITAVHCLLIQNSSAERLDQFLNLFHQFGNSLNGRLIDKTVTVILSFSQVSQRKCTERAKKIILLVGQLITALKKTRTKIVHARQCKRSRHKLCLSKALMHHHDNIFGCVYVRSVLSPSTQQNCSIASLFMTLTKFLSDNVDRDIVIRTLQLMTSCGTCCCFPALFLLKKIIRLLSCTDQRIRNCGLILLERTFYKQMGAFEESTNCELCARESYVEYFDESSKCSSSDFQSSPVAPVPEGKQPKWSCLSLFKDLLLSSDSKLTFLVGSHLLRIIPSCKLAVKQEILFSVFYPVFLKARERFSEYHSEIDKFLIITCLSVFTNLLRRARIVEQFIDQKATAHIMEMLQDKDAMKLCCSIIEIVIITQIWKSEQKPSENNDAKDSFLKSSVNVTEFDFLLEEIRWSSTKCLSMHRDDLEKEADVEDDSITCCDDTLRFSSTHCYQQYGQLLVSLTSLWKTLANLSLYSPQVRQSIHERTTTVLAHSLLVTVLQKITKSTFIKEEPMKDKETSVSQLHLKLAEPLLVICLVCPPAADNPETFMPCEVLVRQLQPMLMAAVASGSVTIRQVCDVLYRASLAQPSSRLVLPTHKMPKVGGLSWEGNDTVMTLVSSTSCVKFEDTVSEYDSSPELTADEGYEADIEIRDQLSEQAEEDTSAGMVSLSASRKVSVDHRRTAQITHPELCVLAIDLVSSFVQCESLSQSQLVDCVYCIQRLSRENCHVLIQHAMVSRLLSQFSDILSLSDTKYRELQCAVLELVSILARHALEPHELAQYIRFFTLDNPPLESLLPPLMSIVANSEVQPSYAFKFPIDCQDRVHLNSQASPAEKTAVTMRQQHVAAGLYSSWSCSAVALPINTDLGWSMWVNGFSIAFWLKLHPSSPPTCTSPDPPYDAADIMTSDTSLSDTWNTENSTLLHSSDSSQKLPPPPQPLPPSLSHLVSVGFDVMVLEVWVEVTSGKLVFRLVRPDGKRQELLCEASVLGQISTDKWHNLAINVRDSVQKRKVVIEVLLLIDGCVSVQVPLVFTGLLIRKARPSCLLLGHCGESNSCYMISSVLMFRAPVFNKENATNLVAHGPDYIHLTQADVGNIKPNLSTVFRVEAIQAGVNWESVYHNQMTTLRELQENLLISYSAESHLMMNAYPQAISNATEVTNLGSHVTVSDKITTVVPLAPRRYHNIGRHGTLNTSKNKGVVGSLFPPTPGFRVATVDTRASQLLPMSVKPIFFAPASIQHYHGITVAADTIGGISVFLLLFARVVELKGSEESQAQALYILLKLAQSSCELNSQFESRDVALLLSHILSSPRCSSSLIMLKVIFDVCCDKPGLMTVHPATGQVSVSTTFSCIVVEPSLLAGLVVQAWRQWAQAPGALYSLLQALQTLLRDDHPHREFNASQFNNARLVESLLHFCKEVFLSGEPQPELDPRICPAVVELIRSLMGAPPDMPHIVAIFDYLVLAHPASATYITTVRPSFYFLVNTAASNTSSSNHSEVDSNIGSMRKSKSMLNNINEVDLPQLTEFTKHRRMTQPVDPTKLNKALANLQIKQLGQQQTVSLTASLDTNRSDILTSSGQGSMDEFSSDDKLTSSQSDNLPLSLPPPTVMAGMDEDKEQAELRQDEVQRLGQLKHDISKKPDVVTVVSAGSAGVTEGLLLLLRDITLVLPDSMVQQVLSHVIKMEALLVMSNHHSAVVRTAVVKVLSAFIQRASEEQLTNFVRSKGYYQLANQLGLWPATVELVEGVVAMVTGLHWLPLEEQLEDEEGALGSLQLVALPPLLSLLANCVHNTALTHNLIHFLQRLFTKVAQGQRALMDCGLVETLCKTLIVISHTPSQPTDLSDISDLDILVEDVQSLLLTILTNAIHSPGNHNMQVVSDILVILRYLERLEAGFCGPKARCVMVLRSTQCVVLAHAENLIQDKINSQQLPASRIRSTASAFLSSVLSPGFDDLEALVSPKLTSNSSSNSDSVNSLSSNSTWGSLGRPNKVPRSEINDRFKMIITKAVEFFIYSERSTPMSADEEKFARRLFSVLLSGMAAIADRRSGSRNTWNTIVWNCRDTVRSMTGQLMMWMMSPGQPNRLRMFVIQSLRNQIKAKDIITSIILINSQIEQQFVLYLWEFMYGADSSSLLSEEIQFCEELKELLQAWSIYSPAAIGHDYDPWTDDLSNMARTVYNQRSLWTKQQEAIVNRTISRMEGVVKAVTESAMAVTRVVVEAQNCERKTVMERLKQSLSDSVHAQLQWKLLAHQLTHERAVWHFPHCYPSSWQLDETEGPARVRKRLKRCHLPIDKRFLKPEFQDKLEAAIRPQPFSFLFGAEGPSMSAVLIERLHTDEKIRHMASARIVTPALEHPGELLIGETCLYFVPSTEPSKLDVTNGSLDACSQAWQFEDVKEIHNRRYQLQERALEIFLLNGKTYLLAFESSSERDLFASELSQCELPHRVASDHLADTVQLWREGHLTNWEYLTTLNKMAGRCYNDLMQYPVMPFVLADYTSTTLDLTDPQSYRNFKKPMAVQEKSSEQHYINNYNELTNALNLISINHEPYHYSSHYSNSGTVLHFLVRLPPFTSMFINYQDNNFDLPDRTFHSLHTTWRLTSSESSTDVKELIPEFFFLPEFLANHEGFNFGTRQNGLKVDEVDLPPWACGDPRRFILIHRQALESDYVRENLPHWIDLVFGYKQTGKAAVESINVFHPATYYGFNLEAIPDPVVRTAWETMVKTYGQTPRQLFRASHPMVVQALVPKTTAVASLPGVKGVSWGNYVGSPSDSSPSVIWQQQHRTPVASLIPLLTNDVFGLAPSTALLLAYSKEKTLSLVATGGMCVLGAALVSWGHPDGILRAKLRKEQPPYPAIRPPRCGGPVTQCVSVPDCNQLWLGYTSGKILVYRYKFKPSKGTLEFLPEPVELLGHNAAVMTLTLCRAYSVALSGARDGSAILWDINRLSYVRSLPSISLPVSLSCVSEVSGDLVTVGSDTDSGGSTVRLHTINVALVGSVTTREQITAVCFSTAPEGVSINVIATGMANGVIKLWSTWDLSAVGEIVVNSIEHPVIGLTYSHDSQHLYASTDNGSVIIWEGSAAKGGSKTPKFLNLTTLI
ncbi:lysosomal-trafficking regulator isoform X2 [Macrosteles quadrilineatus]|uniref:lysosomal-trafficking regulator isoform X2 n=1 Tax=Macrosteles quadrilineatus TaxID=74068 RepID=UPI0023E24515|nr:lysosomal-trafficking regulator isoform X2 [Macrosteles quadrilineatus]